MKLENILTIGKRLDRRYRLTKDIHIWLNRYTRAAVMWGLIVGSMGSAYVLDRPKLDISKPLKQPIEVKAITVEAKEKDWSSDLVGYFRYRGQKIGYNDFEITKLHEVMDCENGLHTADRKNFKYDGENGRYTAAGFAMITKSTFKQHKCEGDRFNGVDNINCFYKIIGDNNGLRDYKESHYCWGKLFNQQTIKFIKL